MTNGNIPNAWHENEVLTIYGIMWLYICVCDGPLKGRHETSMGFGKSPRLWKLHIESSEDFQGRGSETGVTFNQKHCYPLSVLLPWHRDVAKHWPHSSSCVPPAVVDTLTSVSSPGSHDSFSFYIDETSPVGPEQPETVQNFVSVFGTVAKKLMRKWLATQTMNFTSQLEAGVRFFDLRISTKPRDPDNELFFAHGLFSATVSGFLFCWCGEYFVATLVVVMFLQRRLKHGPLEVSSTSQSCMCLYIPFN